MQRAQLVEGIQHRLLRLERALWGVTQGKSTGVSLALHLLALRSQQVVALGESVSPLCEQDQLDCLVHLTPRP